VIDPRIEAIEIVPIAPFRVNISPLVVPDKSIIELRIANKERIAIISVDGDFRKRLTHKDRLTFSRSDVKARFVRIKEEFYTRLNEKIFNYVHP
jgi:NAD+ kinase